MRKPDQLNKAYKTLFDDKSEAGQIVLQDLCKTGQILESTHVPGDPHSSAFNEGRRQIVLGILRRVNRDPVALMRQLYHEQNKENSTTTPQHD